MIYWSSTKTKEKKMKVVPKNKKMSLKLIINKIIKDRTFKNKISIYNLKTTVKTPNRKKRSLPTFSKVLRNLIKS